MITSEELENCDIFPKEYSFSCLFKFFFYSLSSIFAFLLLFSFYNDTDIYSIMTMKYYTQNEDIVINDYLTNKLIEFSQKDFLSKNKTDFIQSYENLKDDFIKEYILKSYPCLIKNSIEYFGVKEILNIVKEKLKNDNNNKIIFEYRHNPYSQFYDEDYQYLRTTYNNYINITKNSSENYYFMNEYIIGDFLKNVSVNIYQEYLDKNDLVYDLDLKGIYWSRIENYVVIWGHMETNEEFICLNEGSMEFILIPPQEKKYIYSYSKRGPINYSRVNFFDGKNKNNENYPDFFKANKVYINLLGGECLYIPAFWWRSYRTRKNKKERNEFLTFKYGSSSKHLENLMYIKNSF